MNRLWSALYICISLPVLLCWDCSLLNSARLKSIMLLLFFPEIHLKSPIILEIIPTKNALLTKLASTNNITTNNYLKIKYESCQQQKISSDVAIDTRNILNLYKCECIMAWKTRQPP